MPNPFILIPVLSMSLYINDKSADYCTSSASRPTKTQKQNIAQRRKLKKKCVRAREKKIKAIKKS